MLKARLVKCLKILAAVLLAFLAILFPFLLEWLYCFFLGDCCVARDAGRSHPTYENLLTYYGVIFGIAASFAIFRWQQKRELRDLEERLKPKLSLSVESIEDYSGAFVFSISNVGDSWVRFCDLCCIDIGIQLWPGQTVEKKISFNAFHGDMEAFEISSYQYSQDESGFPIRAHASVVDPEGGKWSCVFVRNDGQYRMVSPSKAVSE